MEIQCQIIFIKHRFWKIHELETLGTRQRILQKLTGECSCARKHLVAFWHFHTFVCKSFPANQLWTAIKNSLQEKNTGKCVGGSKHDWMLSGTATSLQLFFLKILCLVPKVSNSWIVQTQSFIKIIWHWFSIQTQLFQDTFAYPSRWLLKPW